MKKHLFLLVFALAVSTSVSFASVEVDGIWYNLNDSTQTAEVTSHGSGGYEGEMSISESVIHNATSYDVTGIGDRAFDSCVSLTSVIIPNSVISIGKSAFYCCRSLTSVTIPNSVTCIGDMAFLACDSLTSIDIPNSVTSIGDWVFCGCSSLASVTIPNSVTSIGDRVFDGCSSLASVTIPNSVTSIGNYAFAYCRSLVSITIPNSVTSIGWNAFANCNSLTSVTIPNSVTYISEDAFYDVQNIAYAGTADGAPWGARSMYGYVDGWLVYSDETKSNLITCSTAAKGEVVIPNSVTSIGDQAFSSCSSITSVTIPNSVTSIGSSAFASCYRLTDIYVTCGDLERVKQLLNNDSRVKYSPMPYTITLQAENGSIASSERNTICDNPVTLTVTPDYGYHFARWSDGSTDNPRTIELTQDTTFTAEFAYDRVGYCGKDMALVWSYDPINKVLTINNTGEFTDNMQYGVEAPNELTEIVIGNNVTAIGANAFAGISTLTKLTLGESVKTIGSNAFLDCVNLETIYNYRATPTNAYSTSFDGVDKFACNLYVLPNSIDMYKAASVWRDFYYTYAIGAGTVTEQITDVAVVPATNTAIVTWPVADQAATYTLQITKDEVVFCTLIFNANGQLQGIAFAPGKDGASRHAPMAVKTSNGGLRFTVTGLDSGTNYHLIVDAKDSGEQVIATYTSDFTTTGVATDITNVQSDEVQCTKVIRDGQIYLMYNGQMYNVLGARVK